MPKYRRSHGKRSGQKGTNYPSMEIAYKNPTKQMALLGTSADLREVGA